MDGVMEEVVGADEVRAPHGGRPFGPDNPPPGKGSKKGWRAPSKYLRSLRRVSRQGADQDSTELERMLRKVKDETPDKFLDRLHKAEAEHRRGAGKTAGTSSPAPSSSQPPADAPIDDAGLKNGLAAVEKCLKDRAWERLFEQDPAHL